MIHISNLKKLFDTVEALKGITFDIPDGEYFELLVPKRK